PTVNIDPDNVGSVLNGDIAAYVIQPNKSLTYLFTLGATMKLSVKFDFKGSNLTWNITFVSADLKLLHSTIDNFKMAALRDALTFVGTVYIVPALNEFGAKGIPLPSF
ncbi:hypothetical protein, partial [Salmonella sp. s51944]|uniref:hypothetical protein n=1 Tax=Salmonella sp. s51944 TaxID=3159655 RepID=UPI0039813B36